MSKDLHTDPAENPKRICVIGVGRFGIALIIKLSALGCDVSAWDRRETALDSVRNHVTTCILADATDQTAMTKAALNQYDAVCVTLSHDLTPVLTAVAVLGAADLCRIHFRVTDERHLILLKRLGVEHFLDVEDRAAEVLGPLIVSGL
ncbi:MAG: NAD-binding protein [Verrucomicrobiae bacterium]|nr:NAD-binding protein [Verrucomicrobiae bacterium]MCB1085853.1 NAD-binding protein [Verrucomicrobiae bacterium]MCB1092955.1 NAD-binding protein [Verrucomicrobiae bacterium]